MSPTRSRLALATAGALALAVPLIATTANASATHSAKPAAAQVTPAQAIAFINANMTAAKQVNTKPHINTFTRAKNVNVFQVSQGVFVYRSSMAIDDDGSDPAADPDHQNQTTFQDSTGAQLGAKHVPFYVLGDDCFDKVKPCPHFFFKEHNIAGRQFALMFFQGKVIGAIFGDTQTGNNQTTSVNDSRELGEASVKSAALLGIPSSGISGGVPNGVTVAIFSGPQWIVNGTNANLSAHAQSLVTAALNSLSAGSAAGPGAAGGGGVAGGGTGATGTVPVPGSGTGSAASGSGSGGGSGS